MKSKPGTVYLSGETSKRIEQFFELREILISKRGMRRSGGGVLMRDIPPLIGGGPQLILVQPKDLLDGWSTKQKKKQKSVTASQKLDAVTTEFTEVFNRCPTTKTKCLQAINISPDFSKFVRQPSKEERYRGGSKGSKTLTNYDDGGDLLSELVPRKPSWDFDSILKEFEEDSALSHTASAFNEVAAAGGGLSVSYIEQGSESAFIEIPLEDDEDIESGRIESRREAENQKELTRLFDQILTDIYTHSLPPCAAGRGKKRCPERRSSDSTLPRLSGRSNGHLNRQMSFPGALLCPTSLDGSSQLLQPVKCLSGIDRSSFACTITIGRCDTSKEGTCEPNLKFRTTSQIRRVRLELEAKVAIAGKLLVGELEEKDNLLSEQGGLCEIVTASLQAISNKTSDDARVKFSLTPATQDQSGFQEWARAMRMVARLPDGVPTHFRKNLWLSLAERHLHTKGVSWSQTERRLFSDSTSAEDKELSVQIVKDLHRTGCSLFCGATGQHNQAVLKRVLLAYARWNKNVGYCQGLNMLAALILQVMQGSQSATVKVMIYLIEGVLPESYFANNLRGLSVDMAVFRDLLRLKLPELSKHLDHLQQESKDSGTTYEPPLCDVFTMQWFLTLFSNCLPQSTVLRVWDLVFLEGDQILLRTALAIWQALSDRMMSVRSADEFYSIMAVLTREMMEFGLMEPNSLIKAIDNMVVPEVAELREKYIFNISPWAVGTVAKMGVRLLYSDQGNSNLEDSYREHRDPKLTPFSNHPDREKIALDISTLKRQYWKLKERQRQAHIILSACRSENVAPGSSPALNHLLLGKRALLSAKGRRIEGSVPTPDHNKRRSSGNASNAAGPSLPTESERAWEGQTLTWREARTRSKEAGTPRSPSPTSSSSSSSSTELCDSSDSDESTGAIPEQDPEKTELEDREKQTQPKGSSTGQPQLSPDNLSELLPAKTEDELCLSIERWDTSLDQNSTSSQGSQRLLEEKWAKTESQKSPSSKGTSSVEPKRLPTDWEEADVTASDTLHSRSSRLSRISLSPSGEEEEESQSHSVLSPPSELSFSDRARISKIEGASASDSDTIEKGISSSFSSVTQMDSGELDKVESFSFRRPEELTKGDLHKTPSSTHLVSGDLNRPHLPISSYSSIQLGAAVEQQATGVPSSSHSSMQLGSVEGSSTYSSISSLPKDETLSSDWSKKMADESSTLDKLTGGDSLADPLDTSRAVEEKIKRRKSEIALLQILQENSQILQRIHQAHKVPSPDEPEDIKDIRRRYCYRQCSSLDSPRRTASVESSAQSINRDVTIKLGLPDVNP